MRMWVLTFGLFLIATSGIAAEPSSAEAEAALLRAVQFFHQHVASHGGYVYRYSADLHKQEGEGKTDRDTVWVQPPGTPAVGLAYLDAYRLVPLPELLAAARDAGECLIQGQLRSGGWSNQIEFGERRRKYAYRTEPPAERQFNMSTFDDDKTQAALRFMMRLDEVTGFQDARIHEATKFALDSVLAAQFTNGGWPQGYDQPAVAGRYPVQAATFPQQWSRQAVGSDYWHYVTLNDNSMRDTIQTLFLAERIYRDQRYRDAALRAGDFLLLAQLPEPQPAWAQQYDFQMQPTWARKFEPPAVSGGESQGVIEILLQLYIETGDAKFLAPIPPALAYLQRSQLPDGRLARFYELQTNKPLYFTRTYELTYEADDLPTHYGFIIDSKVAKLEKAFREVSALKPSQLDARRQKSTAKMPEVHKLQPAVKQLLASMDARGAWVEAGRLKYHGKEDSTEEVIESGTFIKNLGILSTYVAATR